ncbi:MAG: ribosome maturation factor RimM [Eubacteriaceae bacterium]
MKDTLEIGKIVTPHGINGEVKIFPITDDKKRFEKLKYVYIKNENKYDKFTITKLRYHKSFVIIKFDEINDRNSAELFKNAYIEINRDDGIKLEEDQYYIVDLIGLKVFENEIELGKLTDVLQTGSTDIYTIQTREKDILVPAIKEYIREINIEKKYMKVTIPEGLKEI